MTDTQSPLDEARHVLQQHFGYNRFKAAQEQVILSALNGEDVLAVLQTGYGKSVCFQVPAAMRDGCAIVISPLIALMKDQVDGAIKRGISASFVNSSLDPSDVTKRLNEFASGAFKLLYVAPERIGTQQFRAALARATVSFIVVDEAHAHRRGSRVLTTAGYRPVESLRVGDEVIGFDHVSNRLVRQPVESVVVRDGAQDLWADLHFDDGSVHRVTSDHPIYSSHARGYIPAAAVQEGEFIGCIESLDPMSIVQAPLSPGREGQRASDEVLLSCVLDVETAGETMLQLWLEAVSILEAEDVFAVVRQGKNGRWFVGSHAPGQSNATAQRARTLFAKVAREGGSFYGRDEGWKRQIVADASLYSSLMVPATVGRVSGSDWHHARWTAALRQGRSGVAVSEVVDRDRRAFTRDACGESERSDTRPRMSVRRVARVSLLEPGSPARCEADSRVYTLTVGGTHTYFADGVLNHNCASMWGHDFRPAFSRIHEISSLLWDANGERPPIIAVTATATADIENDIAASVGMVDGYTRVVGDPIRPNLNYDAFSGTSEWSAVMRVARSRFYMQGKHLVYASTRKGTEKVAQMLCEDFGEKFAAAYHGGMDKDDRTKVQDDFVSGRVRVVCATNAFGMGIDVPDIRTVVHLGVPGSIESYVQETGRAGRDGHPATVVLIDSDYAVKLQRSFIAGSNPPIQLYTTLWNWLLSRCSGGNTLRMSAASIAEDVSRGQAEDVSESAIGTILNVLEGHKLIGREYYEGGAPVTVRMDTDSIAKLKACRVGAWLLKKAEASRSGGGSIEVSVDKTDAPFEIGMSARAFSKELTELDLSDAINVGRVFTGKTTTMLRPDAELLSVLPVELIEKKRKRDLDRFEAMLRYSRLPTHSDRVKFVRSYFLNNG